MTSLSSVPYEIPPTAGLPLLWADFFGTPPESLEAGLAKFIGVPEVQVECSGTAALIVALETLKKRSLRKTVVIPAFTCPLVPLAVHHCGLRIAVCDTEKDRFDFDAAALNRAVDSDTLCIIPAHLGGSVSNLEPALEIAKRSGASLIEDATQSFGAMWRGRPAGTIGEVGFFSLGAGKGLSIYKGGFLFAREPETRAALRETSREIVPSKPLMELVRFFELIGYRIFYNRCGLRFVYGAPLRRHLAHGRLERAVGDEVDPNIPLHKVGEVRKRVGACALARLRNAIAQNAVRAQKRIAELEKIAGVTVVKDLPDSSGACTFIMVLFDSKERCDAALARLWTAGLGVTKLFLHEISDYTFLNKIIAAADAPNARSFAARHLSITNSAWLGDHDFERILDVIRDCARS